MSRMMVDVRHLLTEALAALDAPSMLEHHEVSKALDLAEKAAKESGETLEELQFELIASCLDLADELTSWGTFYRPQMSFVGEDGKRFDLPPLASITAECIAYWTARMNAARHPALRARYADIVWDLSFKATGSKPPIDAARLAIDGYAEALTKYPDMSSHSWGDIRKRTVDLALSINDAERLNKAVASNVAYAYASLDTDESELRLRSLFAILQSIPPRRRPEAEFQAIVDVFRCRVEALDAEGADQFSIDHYALPLVDHYWSCQQQEEAKAVLRMYWAAVERLVSKTRMATLAVGWLDDLYQLLLRYEMNDEAKQILGQIEALQIQVPDDLVPISTSQHISKEEIDEWLNCLVTDNVDGSFANVIGRFLPNLDELRGRQEDIKKDYPLSQMFTERLVDHKGRAIAEIDANDAEGKLIRHATQDIQFRSSFLELGLDHLFKKHSIGPNELFARVTQSPLWQEERHAVLRRGIEAYFAADPIVVVHLLVTEIERAIRVLAAGLGVILQKPNRMGGFDLKNLGDFLADETVTAFFTKSIIYYLRIVLTDRRGLNLRNNTCHGILSSASFTKIASQWLLHIVLLLSAVRSETEAGDQKTDLPHEDSGSVDALPERGD